MTLRLGQKISLGIVALVAVMLAAVLAVSGIWIAGAVRARLERDLAAADQTVAEVLRIRARELSAQTRMLADLSPLREIIRTPQPDAASALDSARSARRQVDSDLLMLVDDRARLLASATEPERHGDNLVGNPAVAAALQGKPFEAMLATDDGIYQIVAAPVRFDDTVAGAIVTGFAVGDPLLASLEDMTGSYVALWSSTVAQVSNRARPIFGDIATRIVATPGSTTTIETSSGPFLVRIGELAGTGVSYALARSLNAEMAFERVLRIRLLATGVLLLLAALLAGLLYSRRVTLPLEALAAGTARLATGDLSSRVEVTSQDEVGELAGAFNRMAAQMQSLVEEERDLAASRAALNAELAELNDELKVEIDERHDAEKEVKRLNEDLEARVAARTAELEAANRQLESFSYSVSHDLKGPLRRIFSYSEILLSDAAPRLEPDEREALERIRTGAAGMGRMVDKLLEFAHVGRSRLERSRIDLSAMARSFAEELSAAAPERDGDFVIADGLVAAGDEALVALALQNLLSNAWKFTSHSPRARIEFGLETGGNGDLPCFFVRDNGAGFESADAARMFHVFERLHSAREFEGHGIGLATVKRIIEHHGGRIWAAGSPGAGSTFRFTLGDC